MSSFIVLGYTLDELSLSVGVVSGLVAFLIGVGIGKIWMSQLRKRTAQESTLEGRIMTWKLKLESMNNDLNYLNLQFDELVKAIHEVIKK